MHCFCCDRNKQLWRVDEWLVRSNMVRRAVAFPLLLAVPAPTEDDQSVVVGSAAKVAEDKGEAVVAVVPAVVGAAGIVDLSASAGRRKSSGASFCDWDLALTTPTSQNRN